mgnify:CR=1 FL=1
MGFAGIDALLGAHAEIHHIHNSLKNRSDDGRTPWGADNQPQIIVFGHDGWRHRRQHALARCHSVLGIAQKPELIGVVGFDGEIIHFVVQKKAAPLHHHFRAKIAVQGGGHSDCIAGRIDD